MIQFIMTIALIVIWVIAGYLYIQKLKKEFNESIQASIKNYLTNDEALIIIYTIIALRGEFVYNLARKIVEDPKPVSWHYEQEKEFLIARLSKTWPNKKEEEIRELINNFYK